MELTRIWEVLRRRKWIIIQALVLITAVAAIGSYLVTPSYRTSSKIMIKQAKKASIDTGNIGLTNVSSVITASPDVDMNRILAMSRPIIEAMVSKLQLRNRRGNLITTEQLTRTGVVSTIRRRIFARPHIAISQYQDTDVLQITTTSPDPEEAMMMANTLSGVMVDDNQTQMRTEYRSARIFLEGEIKEVKGRYNQALRNLTNFKKSTKTIDLEMETKLATEKMAELLKQKEDNIIDLAEARAKLEQLKAELAR